MKFFKRSTSPRPVRRATDNQLDEPRKKEISTVASPAYERAENGTSRSRAGNGVDGGSSGGSRGSGGSWERWRPLLVSRARADHRVDAAAVTPAIVATATAPGGGSSHANGHGVVFTDTPDGDLVLRRSSSAEAAGLVTAGLDGDRSATSDGGSQRSSGGGTASSDVAGQRRRRRRSRRRRVLATVCIVKGPEGFGFTVITARHGQKVNSIIEEDRCTGLLRGDLLLSIDGTELAGLSHDEVVQLLRQCAEGAEATIVVRRRDPADAARLPRHQEGQDGNGAAEVVSDWRPGGDRHAPQLARAAPSSLEHPPPLPPRQYKATARVSTLPLPTHAVAPASASGAAQHTADQHASMNGWMPSASSISTSHASLPVRSADQRWRQLPPPPPEQQQKRGAQVMTLAALQRKYFRQWQEQDAWPRVASRPAAADAAVVHSGTSAGNGRADSSSHRELPPPLPPRPRRKREPLDHSPPRPRQQPEPQEPLQQPPRARLTAVATVAPTGKALARSAAAGAATANATSGVPSYRQQAGAVRTTRSSSASPDRADGPRDRHLHLLRSLAFSAPSLAESTRRLAAEALQQPRHADSIPHFATMARRPKKPDGLRPTVAGDRSASSNSVGNDRATVRWRHATSSWDRLARSRTPEGTASFWQRARPSGPLRDGPGSLERPASSAGSLLRRPSAGIRLEGVVAQRQQHSSNSIAAGGRSVNGTTARSGTALLLPPPSQQPAITAASNETPAAMQIGLGGSLHLQNRNQGPESFSATAAGSAGVVATPAVATGAAAAAAAAQSSKTADVNGGAGAAAQHGGSLAASTLPRAAGRLPSRSDETSEARHSDVAIGKYQVVELDVTLYRQESGFGFCLVGGPEGGTQVSVGRLAPGGSADLDGILRTGDEILAVDGVPTTGVSHYRVVQLMGVSASRGKVDLRVRRRLLIQAAHNPAWADTTDHVDTQLPPTSPTNQRIYTAAQWQPATAAVQRVMPVAAPTDDPLHASSCSITLTQQPTDDGFGILIMTPRQQPHERLAEVKIGQILPSSPAARCGRLFVGDRILAINGMAVSGMPHDAVVALIKERGRVVTIAVATGQLQYQDGDGGGHSSVAGRHNATGGHAPQGSFDNGGEDFNGSLTRQDSFLEVSAVPCVGQSCPDTPELSVASALRKKDSSLRSQSHFIDPEVGAVMTYPNEHLTPGRKHVPSQQDVLGAVGTGLAAPGGRDWGSQRIDGSYCQLDAPDGGATVRSPTLNGCSPDSQWPVTPAGYSRSTTMTELSASAVAAAAAMAKDVHAGMQPSVVTVDLMQDSRGFGFSVRGGHEFGAMPLCVLRLAPGGAAERSGKLQVGDEILEINGYRTVGMRHADAIALIQDAGTSVRLTVRRSNPSPPAKQPAPAATGEAGSPRSSPTGSSANGSNGCVNAEKWWTHSEQTPPAAAADTCNTAGSYFSPSLRANAERSKSTSSAGRNFGGSTSVSAAVAPSVQRSQKPVSNSGSGLLMQAPRWQSASHHTLPSAAVQQQHQLSPAEEPDDVFLRRLGAGVTELSSPRAATNDDVKGSRSYLAASGYRGGEEHRQMHTATGTASWSNDHPASGYLSPGATGSLRFSADLETPRLAGGGRLSLADAAGMGKLAGAPFGFYETLLRQVPSA